MSPSVAPWRASATMRRGRAGRRSTATRLRRRVEVVGQEVDRLDAAAARGRPPARRGPAERRLDAPGELRGRRAAERALELDPVEAGRVVARRHDEAAGRLAGDDAVGHDRRRHRPVGQEHAPAIGREDVRGEVRDRAGVEAGVVAHDERPRWPPASSAHAVAAAWTTVAALASVKSSAMTPRHPSVPNRMRGRLRLRPALRGPRRGGNSRRGECRHPGRRRA